LITVFQVVVSMRAVTTTSKERATASVQAKSRSDEQPGWFIESYKDGLITVQREGVCGGAPACE
jgi:hypothetical protein